MKQNKNTSIHEEQENVRQKISILDAIHLLPPPLKESVMKRFGGAVIALVATVVIVCNTKEWTNCIGLLITLLFIYMGLDIIWKFADNKIQKARVVVSKAKKGRHGQIHTILRNAGVADVETQDVQTFSCNIPIKFRDKQFITAGTVLDIYVNEDNPYAVLAYEILGETN